MKECPGCGMPVAYWQKICPNCGTGLRDRCPDCGLPHSGEGDLCQCGQMTEAELERFRRTAPPKSDNRGNGGRGHGWLGNRRRNRAAA